MSEPKVVLDFETNDERILLRSDGACKDLPIGSKLDWAETTWWPPFLGKKLARFATENAGLKAENKTWRGAVTRLVKLCEEHEAEIERLEAANLKLQDEGAADLAVKLVYAEAEAERVRAAIRDSLPDLEYALTQLYSDSWGCSAVTDQQMAIRRLKSALEEDNDG